jgi:hypothetical protein
MQNARLSVVGGTSAAFTRAALVGHTYFAHSAHIDYVILSPPCLKRTTNDPSHSTLQAVVRFFVLPLVRLYIETVGRAYRRLWYECSFPVAIDGYHPGTGVAVRRYVPYGSEACEVADVCFPDKYAAEVGPRESLCGWGAHKRFEKPVRGCGVGVSRTHYCVCLPTHQPSVRLTPF